VFERDVVGDQGQVFPEHRAGGRGELEGAVLDQAHHGERSESLRGARRREQGLDGVGDGVGPVGEAIGLGELHLVTTVDAHHTGERGARRRRIDRVFQRLHPSDSSEPRAVDATVFRGSGFTSRAPDALFTCGR